MTVNVMWFMLLNMALTLPTAIYFTSAPMPYEWMRWLGIPAVIAGLMIGIGYQIKVRNREEMNNVA